MGLFLRIKAIFGRNKKVEAPDEIVSEKPAFSLSNYGHFRDVEKEFTNYPEPYFQFDIDKMDFDKKEDIQISVEREKFLLAFLIGRNAQTPGVAKYWTIEFNTNFNEVIQRFISGGYLEIREDLDLEFSYFSVPELKNLLRENELPVSGRRQELIDRLKNNLPEDELYKFFGGRHRFFIGTPKSEQIKADYRAGLLNSHPKPAPYNYDVQKRIAESELRSYKESSIEKYEILGADITNACDKCMKMNGKVLQVSRAVIGVNFPPFCEKCRCTTVACFEKD